MNQVTNLVQWKNLTQEQKDEFDFQDYKYTVQIPTNSNFYALGHNERPTSITDFGSVYRLVIEDDKWYTGFINGELVTCLGSCFDGLNPEIFRPAKPDEIPQDERTLDRKIEDQWPDKEVVMLGSEDGVLRIHKTIDGCEYDYPHILAPSMKGFYKYVYEQDNDLIASLKTVKCWKCKTIQPVAALFEEGRR